MTTVEEERELTINALRSFKKTFPRGFSHVFSGNRIQNLREHWERNIEGLMQPLQNQVDQTIADFFTDTGLGKLVENIGKALTNIIKDIKKVDGIDDLIEGLGDTIDGGALTIIAYLAWIKELWDTAANWLNNVPPPPFTPPTPLADFPLEPGDLILPIGGGPDDLLPGGPLDDDDGVLGGGGGFGFHEDTGFF